MYQQMTRRRKITSQRLSGYSAALFFIKSITQKDMQLPAIEYQLLILHKLLQDDDRCLQAWLCKQVR